MAKRKSKAGYVINPKLVRIVKALTTPDADLCPYLACIALEAFCRAGFMNKSPLTLPAQESGFADFIAIRVEHDMKNKKHGKIMIANMTRWLSDLKGKDRRLIDE